MIYLMYLRTVRTVMTSITTFRRCPNCSQGVLFSQIPQYDDVAREVNVDRHRVDVALLRDGIPVSGIEVRDTHPVDEAKWDAFKELRFPCIEVESKDVIYMWQYLRQKNGGFYECQLDFCEKYRGICITF